MDCLQVVPFKWVGLILQSYEYAVLGSLQISLHSHFSCISDLVFTCGLIPEFLLAAIQIQSSLATGGHDFRI